MKKILEKYDIFDELIDGLDDGVEAFLENLIQDRVSSALDAKNEQYQKLTGIIVEQSKAIADMVGMERWEDIQKYIYYMTRLQNMESYACFFAGMRFQKEFLG